MYFLFHGCSSLTGWSRTSIVIEVDVHIVQESNVKDPVLEAM